MMLRIGLSCCIIGLSCIHLLIGQSFYHQAYGDAADPAIIFLHGGPGYNSVSFERTTAQKLADAGFYVVVYDRRGEGRSPDPQAAFTFAHTLIDLDSLYQFYGLSKAHLIGQSFGGMVGLNFSAARPKQVASLILAGAPIDLQATFKHIIQQSRDIYTARGDSNNLFTLDMLEAMDTSSVYYSGYTFMHAMGNGFYTPDSLIPAAQALYAQFQTDSVLRTYASQMTQPPVFGFWQNEQYTTLNLTEKLSKVLALGVPVYGIYGQEDGLYSSAQVQALQHQLGQANFRYWENCSHNAYLDRPSAFISTLKTWLK